MIDCEQKIFCNVCGREAIQDFSIDVRYATNPAYECWFHADDQTVLCKDDVVLKSGATYKPQKQFV